MKKILLLLAFTFSAVTYAQEEDYSVFLDDALEAINNNDEQQYIAFIKVFTAALEEKKITPQNIPQSYMDKYVETILKATLEKIKITDEIAQSAKTFFEYEIQKNNADAMTCMGFFYEMGYAVPQDYQKAKHHYQQAIELGNGSGMYCLAYLYHRGLGVARDYEKAAYWYKKATDKNNIRAMNNLGIMYTMGQGVDKDDKKGLKLLHSVAEQGYHMGATSLAGFYLGNAPEEVKDCEKGLFWLNKALQQQNKEARYLLRGNLLVNGGCVEKNEEKGKELLHKAIENDMDGAYALLAIYYFKNQKDAEGIKYIKLGAQKENPECLAFLGMMYLQGLGVPKDEKKGLEILNKLCSSGIKEYCELLKN